jgi:hypothetical protein
MLDCSQRRRNIKKVFKEMDFEDEKQKKVARQRGQ